MATGTKSDFTIYEDEYYSGAYETLTQKAEVFNGASRNAVQLIPRGHKGDYTKSAFFKNISSMIARRDITSVSAADDLKLETGENIGVKLNRRIGPIGQTIDAWKKIGEDPRQMSFILGGMAMQNQMVNYVNAAMKSVEAAIEGNAAYNVNGTDDVTKTLTTDKLIEALALMGDAGQRVVAWVMHSKPFYDLMNANASSSTPIDGIATDIIRVGEASSFTLGRPVIITDDASLTDANGSATDTYNVLGLVESAVSVQPSEDEEVFFDRISGLDNLIYRYQAEFAYTVNVKGFQWDTSAGGVNPTDAALATTTNWDQVASDDKDTAGVRIKVQ
jgi:hypothetical protein